MNNIIYTIGHSNHPPELLLSLLTEARIELLADVRSHPGSHWVSYANPHDLKPILESAGIHYLYLGDVLGGHPDDSSCYDSQTGKPNYEVIQSKKQFQQGLSTLLEAVKKYRVCVMCTEEDPSFCHRNLLVGEGLRRKGIQILHIRGNGEIQTDEELWKGKAGVGVNQFQLPLGDI